MNPPADWVECCKSNSLPKHLLAKFGRHLNTVELVIAEVGIKKLCLILFSS